MLGVSFARLHVVPECSAEVLECLKARICIVLYFCAAIIIDVVHGGTEEDNSRYRDHGVSKPVVSPNAGRWNRITTHCGSTMLVLLVCAVGRRLVVVDLVHGGTEEDNSRHRDHGVSKPVVSPNAGRWNRITTHCGSTMLVLLVCAVGRRLVVVDLVHGGTEEDNSRYRDHGVSKPVVSPNAGRWNRITTHCGSTMLVLLVCAVGRRLVVVDLVAAVCMPHRGRAPRSVVVAWGNVDVYVWPALRSGVGCDGMVGRA